ncbi:hypothetical protein LXA43DRAFT_1060983 [Ganoderma leucocontextum]|nr:hypothetical protein LXA43DRAFT_1060983 [Ganoderma leucocontextum]
MLSSEDNGGESYYSNTSELESAFNRQPNHFQAPVQAPAQAPVPSQSFYVSEPHPHPGGYPAQQAFVDMPQPQPVQARAAYSLYLDPPHPSSEPSASASDPFASDPLVSAFDPQDPELAARLCAFATAHPLTMHFIHSRKGTDQHFASLGRTICQAPDEPDGSPSDDARFIVVAKRVYRHVQQTFVGWYKSWNCGHSTSRSTLSAHVAQIQAVATFTGNKDAPDTMPWKDSAVTSMGGCPPLWGYLSDANGGEGVHWTDRCAVSKEEAEQGRSSKAAGKMKEINSPDEWQNIDQTVAHQVPPSADVPAQGTPFAPSRAPTIAPSSASVQGPPVFGSAQQNVVSFQQNIQHNTVSFHAHSDTRLSHLSHSHSSHSLPDRQSIQDPNPARSLTHSHSLPSGLAEASVPSLSSGLGNPIQRAQSVHPTLPTEQMEPAHPTEESPPVMLTTTGRYVSSLVQDSRLSVNSGGLSERVHGNHLCIGFRYLDAVTRAYVGPSAPSTPPPPAVAPHPPIPTSAPSALRSSSSSGGMILTPPDSSTVSSHSGFQSYSIAPGASGLEAYEGGYAQPSTPFQDVDFGEVYGNVNADGFTGNQTSDAAHGQQNFQDFAWTQ